jgi:hypothetical protein
VWHYDVDALWQAWAATTDAPQSARSAIRDLLERERAALATITPRFTSSTPSATLDPRARREDARPPPPST